MWVSKIYCCLKSNSSSYNKVTPMIYFMASTTSFLSKHGAGVTVWISTGVLFISALKKVSNPNQPYKAGQFGLRRLVPLTDTFQMAIGSLDNAHCSWSSLI